MRTNGTLKYLVSQPFAFDDDGMPTSGEATWSNSVECFIRTNTHNTRGTYQDGKFTQASYEVLIERQPLLVRPSRVRLVRYGYELGEFDVQDIQLVQLDRIKILV